jgi:cytochrome d ubiquinol oxidase subunit I
VGRQPWTVYGLLRTADSVSPSLTGMDVILSLIGYLVVYLLIFPVGLLLMVRTVRKGPVKSTDAKEPIEGGQPSGPVVTPPEYLS